MNVVDSAPRSALLPFEVQLLQAVARALDAPTGELLWAQVQAINGVKRPLDWRRIEFRCRRLLFERWPAQVLFARRERFRLAQVECRFGAKPASIAVWADGGHVTALESPVGLSGLAISGPLEVTVVQAR